MVHPISGGETSRRRLLGPFPALYPCPLQESLAADKQSPGKSGCRLATFKHCASDAHCPPPSRGSLESQGAREPRTSSRAGPLSPGHVWVRGMCQLHLLPLSRKVTSRNVPVGLPYPPSPTSSSWLVRIPWLSWTQQGNRRNYVVPVTNLTYFFSFKPCQSCPPLPVTQETCAQQAFTLSLRIARSAGRREPYCKGGTGSNFQHLPLGLAVWLKPTRGKSSE